MALIALLLSSCGSDCYEQGEPEVYIMIHNNCLYSEVNADGIKKPLVIDNNCASNTGAVTITLPILENKKTYYFTDGANIIDSFTIEYTLDENFQNGCGYVISVNNFQIDSNATSLPFIHEFEAKPNDSLSTYFSYSTFADYMRNYY